MSRMQHHRHHHHRRFFTPATAPTLLPNAVIGVNTDLGSAVFDASYQLNQPVDALLVSPLSAGILGIFGGYVQQSIGMQINIVDSRKTRFQQVGFVDGGASAESDLVMVPIPDNAAIEIGSDQHLIVVDVAGGWVYELDGFVPATATSPALCYALAIFDMLSATPYRPMTWTSADDAGLCVLHGLLRYEEALSGAIRHSLRFTISQTAVHAFVLPASHGGGSSDVPTQPVEGMRFRLRADWQPSGPLSPINQAIATCLKTYGMHIADNGDTGLIQTLIDPRWDYNDLQLLQEQLNMGAWFDIVDSGPTLYYNALPVVAPPVIDSFSVSRSADGSTMTFSWSVSGQTYIYLSGLMPLRGSTGSLTLPYCPGTYTLVANNQSYSGSTTATASV